MASSTMLSNLRKSFINAAKNIEKKIEKSQLLTNRDAAYVKSLRAEADRFRNLAKESYVGRSGTKEERKQRINTQYNKLMNNYESVKSARSGVTQKGIKSAINKRERQEKIFTLQMRSRAKTDPVDNSIFWQQTQQFWRGSKTPEERLSRITAGLGASNIFEARSKILEMYYENKKEIDLLKNRDWRGLKQQGWSDDLINEAKRYDARGELYEFIIEHFYN